MRVTIEANEKEMEGAVLKTQEPVSGETLNGGMQVAELPLANVEIRGGSALHQSKLTGLDAGAAPQWLLEALQYQATAPEVSVSETTAVTDGGTAPSE
jgi:hypothetical protein